MAGKVSDGGDEKGEQGGGGDAALLNTSVYFEMR